MCLRNISSASTSCWSTSIRTPTSPNICGCGCWPRAAATSAASATTTSRSMAGAAPRSTTSCASRTDFPGAKIIRLERNYRSTANILGAASGLIAHNRAGSARRSAPTALTASKVEVQGCWDDEEEARIIGEDIEQLQRKGQDLSEIAILVRASFQMRAFEDRFITLGLPYRVVGGPRFYERQEIKDATAYFEVTPQPGQRSEIRAHHQYAASAASATSSLKSLHRACPRARHAALSGRPRRSSRPRS